MNDRAVALLEQYDIEVLGTNKGRGAILCDTSDGRYIFKEYTGSTHKLEVQNKLLNHIYEDGRVLAERLIPTREGELSVKDADGTVYILKTYREGRECNIYDQDECMEAVKLLAKLHECTEILYTDMKDMQPPFLPEKEYEKRNRELKRVKKFIRQRSQKSAFEIALMDTYDRFYEQALEVCDAWEGYSRQSKAGDDKLEKCVYCHGDYQYHNIIRTGKDWFLVNFEKCVPDNGIRDLYLLMRKLLEKSNWSVPLGKGLLDAYGSQRKISAFAFIDLYYRLSYPEKFWKIVNFYYNTSKAWIPDRNSEKLDKLVKQEADKQKFLDEVFRNVEGLRQR